MAKVNAADLWARVAQQNAAEYDRLNTPEKIAQREAERARLEEIENALGWHDEPTEDDEDSDEDDDGQPDEAQEWHDFDKDC